MKSLTFAIIAVAAITALPAKAANVLTIEPVRCDSAIIAPESFEVDVDRMQQNWYLKNFVISDADTHAQGATLDDTPDQVIIERLQLLPTEIEMPFNSIVRSLIARYVERSRKLITNLLGLSIYYMPIFEQALDRYGLPLELKYLPVVESAIDPNAVSRAGATGLWQFMIPTGRGLNLEINSVVDERRDPYASSDAAARYLKELYQTFDDWSLAIAAYNCGPGNVNKALRRAGGGKKDFWEIYPFLPAETRAYVPTFIAANYAMNYYNCHDIPAPVARRPLTTDTVRVNRRVHFEQIAEVLDIPIEEIRILNPQYRLDHIPGDIRPYTLVLPSLQTYAYLANEDSIINHRAADFARRDVVEPATGTTVRGQDDGGEYVVEEVVQYYTVRRGDTLAKIAQRFGVTISEIQKVNKCGRSVKRGQKLKIVTTRRRYVAPTPAPDATATADSIQQPQLTIPADSVPSTPEAAPADSIEAAIAAAAALQEPGNMGTNEADSTRSAAAAAVAAAMQPATNVDTAPAEPARQTPPAQTRQTRPSTPTTYTVRRGDNLFKIATRHGITVDALKRANGLTSDKIQVGQKLKIPRK